MGIKIKQSKYNNDDNSFLYLNERFGINCFVGSGAEEVFSEISKNAIHPSYEIYLNSFDNQNQYIPLNETSCFIFDFTKQRKNHFELIKQLKDKVLNSENSINILIRYRDEEFDDYFLDINSFLIEKGIKHNILFFLTSEYQERLVQQLISQKQIFKFSKNVTYKEKEPLPLIDKQSNLKEIDKKKKSFINNTIVSLLLLVSMASAFVVGFNLQSSKIDAIFDYIGYTVEESELQRGFANVKGLKDDNPISYDKYLNMHNYIRKNYGGNNNSYILSGQEEPVDFKLNFSGVDDFNATSKVIGVSVYSNSKKMEFINLELYKNLYPDHYTKGNTQGTVYLPSSIADSIIIDPSNEYETYDDIVEKMIVEVSGEQNGKFYTALWGVGNIFFDTYESDFYEGLDKGYGSELKEFLGSYVITTSRTLFSEFGSTLCFDITQSLFSTKSIVKDTIYENSNIDSASVDFFVKQNGVINNFYSINNVNDVFSVNSLNLIQILFVSLTTITLLVTILLIVHDSKNKQSTDEGLIDLTLRKTKFVTSIFNEYFFITIPFVLIHIIAVFSFNKNSMKILQAYNVFGNAYSVAILIALSLFIYFTNKKKINNREKDHE